MMRSEQAHNSQCGELRPDGRDRRVHFCTRHPYHDGVHRCNHDFEWEQENERQTVTNEEVNTDNDPMKETILKSELVEAVYSFSGGCNEGRLQFLREKFGIEDPEKYRVNYGVIRLRAEWRKHDGKAHHSFASYHGGDSNKENLFASVGLRWNAQIERLDWYTVHEFTIIDPQLFFMRIKDYRNFTFDTPYNDTIYQLRLSGRLTDDMVRETGN